MDEHKDTAPVQTDDDRIALRSFVADLGAYLQETDPAWVSEMTDAIAVWQAERDEAQAVTR